jgi:hypothetical protein
MPWNAATMNVAVRSHCKAFALPIIVWMHKHRMTHGSSAQLHCPLDRCSRQFKTNYSLRQHMLTLHDGQYPRRCLTCARGFPTQRKMDAHRCSPERQPSSSQEAIDDALCRELIRFPQQACVATATPHGRTKTICSRCLRPMPPDDPAAFSCMKRLHWSCPACLHAQGLRSDACSMAPLARVIVKVCAVQQGCAVSSVEPDCWCLLSCVVKAVPQLGNKVDILRRALVAIKGEPGQPMLDELVPATTKDQARRLLARLVPGCGISARGATRATCRGPCRS